MENDLNIHIFFLAELIYFVKGERGDANQVSAGEEFFGVCPLLI